MGSKDANKGKAAKSAGEKGVHEGHRARLSAQIEKTGLSSLPDHVALEFLLFYVIPRRDTNPLAHALIDRFGSLSAVFDANERDLQSVKGVGPAVARFLKVFPMVNELYALEKLKGGKDAPTIEEIGAFLVGYYLNKTEEEVYAFFFDNAGRLIGRETVCRGSVNAAGLPPRALLDAICRRGAVSVILAHNHPAGSAEPSPEVLSLTRHLMDAFIPFGISIKAHLVVARGEYVDLVPIIYKDLHTRPRYIAVKASDPTAEMPDDPPAENE